VVIKFRISRILIPIVVDLFIIIVVVVVMPLMPVVFSCHKIIKTPQQSSKAIVTCISASIPSVSFFTSRTKA
jgi:hypothetical protein